MFERNRSVTMRYIFIFISVFGVFLTAKAQYCSLAHVNDEEKISSSVLVIEGEVIEKFSFWGEERRNIFTSNLIRVTKIFKGELTGTNIEIITEGGQIGDTEMSLTNTLHLETGDAGVLFCERTPIDYSGRSVNSGVRMQVYASLQGFLRYNREEQTAWEPFRIFHDIETEVHPFVQELAGKQYIDVAPLYLGAIQPIRKGASVAATPVIGSFSPTTITAGTRDTLTINGSNFNATRGTGRVEFRNSNDGGSTYIYPASTDYISWSNTQIRVLVPSNAGTGTIRVRNSDPATGTSSSSLTVQYARLTTSVGGSYYPTDFVNDNSTGGYTWSLYTGFFNNTAARNSFLRAFASWRCSTSVNDGPNWEIGPNTSTNTAASDGINIVRFDVGSELPAGVLGRTTLMWNTPCAATAYTYEMDIVFDSGTNWEFGPQPASGGKMDFETVAVHELGHAMQLGHVIASSEIMHYAVAPNSNKRSLNANDIDGGNAVLSHSIQSNSCGPSPMTPLTASVSSNVKVCPAGSTTLLAKGGSEYSWSPATGLSATDIPNPVATPSSTTTYTVTIGNGSCFSESKDVTVSVLTIDAGPDKDICNGGSVQIGNPAQDGTPTYSYSWSPTTGLNNPNSAQPMASPTVTTTYIVTVTDAASCVDRDTVVVTVGALAANAGPDVEICTGSSTQLSGSATGGIGTVSYSWDPPTGLSASNISNPIASPVVTTAYVLTVSDGSSCQSRDTVIVTVRALPAADAGTDKNVCFGFSTSIGSSSVPNRTYAWSPTTGLNNPNISNPIASPSVTTNYVLTVTDQYGCFSRDTVEVRVQFSDPLHLTWTGAAGPNWNTIGSWDKPCSVPATGSNVIIPSGITPPANNPSIRLNSLKIDHASGYTLANDIQIDSALTMTGGHLVLGNSNLTISVSGSIIGAGSTRYIITNGTGVLRQEGIGSAGRSQFILFPVGATNTRYTPASIYNWNLSAHFDVRVFDGVRANGLSGAMLSDHVVAKTWVITASGGSPDAEVKLAWNATDELTPFDRSNSFIARHDGTGWTPLQLAQNAIGGNPYSLTATNVTNFSLFAVGDLHSPLPVEIQTFSAMRIGHDVALQWTTASEVNTYGFAIERSFDLQMWNLLALVPATNQRSGSTYRWKNIASPQSAAYRLRIIDFDGTSSYSNVISVTEFMNTTDFSMEFYPNPLRASDVLTIRIAAPDEAHVTIGVFNILGERVATLIQQPFLPQSQTTISFNLPDLPAGTYILRLTSAEKVEQKLLSIVR